MTALDWIAIGIVVWIAFMLAAARFCAMNTISEENDQRVVDEAVEELRNDMDAW